MTIFRSFQSTIAPFLSRKWPADLKLLVDPVTGSPTGIQSPNANGPHGIWSPVDLTAAQIASPTADMMADLSATYRLNVAPYTRYQSTGTGLIPLTNNNSTLSALASANRAPLVTDDVNSLFLDAGQVASITPFAVGSGFTTATVSLTAAPAGGVTATATTVISGGKIIGYRITNNGKGYLVRPTVTITGDGTGANAQAALSPGDLWVQVSPTKAVWQLADSTAGNAAWLPYFGTSGTPADVGPAAMGLYGLIKLRSAYVTNSCIDVTRASDNTTQTIGFIGNVVDGGLADAFCAGTTGRITKWYDQSGNVADMSVPAANASYWTGNTYNGFRVASFASIASQIQVRSAVIAVGGSGYVAGDQGKIVSVVGGTGTAATITIVTVAAGAVTVVSIATAGAYTVFPTSPAATTGGSTTGTGLTLTLTDSACWMTATMAAPFTTGSATMMAAIIPRTSEMTDAFGSFGASGWAFYMADSALGTTAGMAHNANNLSLPVSCTPDVVSFSGQATGMRVQNGNRVGQITATAGTSVSAVTIAATNAGGSTGPGAFDTVAFLLYPTLPTPAQMLAVRASLYLALNVSPQVLTREVWVSDGDSITAGYNPASLLRTYPRQALPMLNRQLRQHNIGVFGQTLTSQQSNFATIFLPAYDPGLRVFIVSVAEGTNDIAGAITGQTLWNTAVTYYAQIKSLGANVKLIACTLLPRAGLGGAQAEMDTYNALVRAGWQAAGADALCDFNADPVMGAAGVTSNTALYADGTHPTDVGLAYMAKDIAAVVNLFLT